MNIFYPPLTLSSRPRGLRLLIEAINAPGRASWFFLSASKILELISGEKQGRSLLELRDSVFTPYVLANRLRIDDISFYLRMMQAFGLVEVNILREPPRSGKEIILKPTLLSQLVVGNVKISNAYGVIAFYLGLLVETPARIVMEEALIRRGLEELAYSDRLDSHSLYTRFMRMQLELALKRQNKPLHAWYEPITDITGVILLLCLLQIVYSKKARRTIIAPRRLNRIEAAMLRKLPYGEYLLPRAWLFSILDCVVNNTDIFEYHYGRCDYSPTGVIKELSKVMPRYVAEDYTRVLYRVRSLKNEIIEYINTLYNG